MGRIGKVGLTMVLLGGALLGTPAGEIYRWTDEEGVTHFATSLDDVPERYRDQVDVRVTAPEPDPPQTAEANVDAPPLAPDPSAAAAGPGAGLRRFEIPYQAYEGSARRVIIPVTFNGRVTAPMALDTGSPGMVISVELAQKLGLFSRDSGTLLIEAAGIGGAQAAVLTIIDSVSVEQARDSFVPTTVTTGLSDEFDGLIGMDFLANYTISIDSAREVLVFQETPPRPNTRGGHDEAWWRKTFREFRAARDYWRERKKSYEGRPEADAAKFVEFQARESERLLQRLDLYASDNAVPRHWR